MAISSRPTSIITLWTKILMKRARNTGLWPIRWRKVSMYPPWTSCLSHSTHKGLLYLSFLSCVSALAESVGNLRLCSCSPSTTCWGVNRFTTCWGVNRFTTCWGVNRLTTCWGVNRFTTCWGVNRFTNCPVGGKTVCE